GSLHGRTITTTSADRRLVTTTRDLNGDGATDQSETINKVANGTLMDAVYHYNPDGSLRDELLTATTAIGLLRSTSLDLNGDGVFDLISIDAVSLNADGSRTEAVTDYSGAVMTERDQAVTTASANGLSRTVQTDSNGDGTFDRTVTDVTVLNADASRTETVTGRAANGTVVSTT